MAKNVGSASTGRFTAKATSARAPKSVSKSTPKSAAAKSVNSKAAPSKSTPSKSAASKAAAKTPSKGASKSATRSARTGRNIKTAAPTALAGGTTRTNRRTPLTTVTKSPATRVRARSAATGRSVEVKRSQVRQVKVRTAEVRDAAHQLRVDTFGPVDSIEIHRLDELVTDADEITVVGRDNRRVPVAGALLKALATVMGAMGRGATVTVSEGGQLDTELTSQEAADLLNVSRPYVVKLARDGVLPHHRVGNRHRFALADVLEHRGHMRATAEEALTALAPSDGYTAADF